MSWFAQPWGLLALLSLPAVVVLHLYRRRHHEVPVSTLFLWVDAETEDSSGRVRHPLRRTPSFWLELAAALLASLAVAGFDPWRGGEAVHLVAVLDDSASMLAADADGDSPRARVVEHLRAAFDEHGRRTRVTLLASGPRPRLLCGPAALVPEAVETLAAWRPGRPDHDLAPALALGRELAGDGELWLLSDRLPAPGRVDDRTRVTAFGTPRDNLALLDPERGVLDADTDRLRCRVRSFAGRPVSAVLTVSVQGRELTRRSVALEPGEATGFALELPADTPAVSLALSPDALTTDDGAVLHPAPRRRVRVGWSLDDGLPLALGLDGLSRVFDDVTVVDAQPDLVLGHVAAAPPAWSLVLPHDDGGAEAFLGPFLVQKQHALLAGVTLDGVLWTRAHGEPLDGLPLVSAGDRALLTEVVRDEAPVYTLDLLPLRSTLQRSPDWPILMANLIDQRRAALPGPQAVNLVAGETFVCTADSVTPWTLHGPDGARELGATRRVVLDDLPVFGDYRLERPGAAPVRFAVNLVDPAESDLLGATSGTLSPGSDAISLAAGAHDGSLTALVLLVLLAAVLAGDWWVLGRGPRR